MAICGYCKKNKWFVKKREMLLNGPNVKAESQLAMCRGCFKNAKRLNKSNNTKI